MLALLVVADPGGFAGMDFCLATHLLSGTHNSAPIRLREPV